MTDPVKRTAADIKADCKKWGQRGVKWVKEGQALAMEVLAHVDAHGDTTVADTLYLSMPKGSKSASMAEFLVAFGKMVPNDGQTSKTNPFKFDKNKQTDLAGAAKKPWYDFRPEPTPLEVFDVQDAAIKAIQRIKTQAGKAQSTTHGETMALLDELLAELTSDEEVQAMDEETASK